MNKITCRQVCMLDVRSKADKLLCLTAAGDAGLGGAAAHSRLQQALQAQALPDMGLPEGDDLLGMRTTPHCTPVVSASLLTHRAHAERSSSRSHQLDLLLWARHDSAHA